jgi:phage terminase small subunit
MRPLTLKQQNFCMAYVENQGNASEAYRQTYNAGKMQNHVIKVKASELIRDGAGGNVAVTIKELQNENRKRHAVTVESLTNELDEARALAKTEGQAAAMVAASNGKAKLHGLLIDKTEVKTLSLIEVLNAAR